jgi:flagellum-specific peptidoglycan hydrolase FlgJ
MGMTENQKDFVEMIYNNLKKYAPRYHLKCYPVIIAQAIMESGWGISYLARKNNFFGLKCGRYWKGKSVNLQTKEEYAEGTLTKVRANFRVYDNPAQGVKGYCEFLMARRYSNLKDIVNNETYITLLCKDGYATSRSYKKGILNLIATYDLNKYSYDSVKDIDTVALSVLRGNWGNGEERRKKLESAGYDYNLVRSRVNELKDDMERW